MTDDGNKIIVRHWQINLGNTFDGVHQNIGQAPPKLPVSSAPVDVVPHIIIRSPRLQPGPIVFSDAKRLLQHYRHLPDVVF